MPKGVKPIIKEANLYDAMAKTNRGKLMSPVPGGGVSPHNWPHWFQGGKPPPAPKIRVNSPFVPLTRERVHVLSKALKGGGKIAPILLLAGLLGSMGLGD